jgi:hypothetical protein
VRNHRQKLQFQFIGLFGFAAGFRDAKRAGTEWMVSLKIM